VITASYLEPAPVTTVVDRGGIQMTFHSQHRPLEACSRALEAAGMLINAVREVGSNDKLATSDPAQHRWMRIPLFLHIRAIKSLAGPGGPAHP